MKPIIVIGMVLVIALAFAMPASAMVYYSGGEKLGTNNIVPITNDPPSTGTLNIYTMCLQGAYSNTVIMTPLVPVPNMTEPLITNGLVNPALISTYFEQVPPSTTITLGADGQYSGLVAPGIYELELTDGNAGQPEYALVQIVAGGNVMVRFIGHAANGGVSQNVPSTSPITVTFAQYIGAWNAGTGKYGIGGHESLQAAIQTYLNDNPTVTTFKVSVGAGTLYINGNPINVGDPASGWVKTLTVAYTYKDSNGHTKIGGFLIAENDAKNYNDSLLKLLPETGTITT